jgi:N-acetylmuramoyl-L-alanine amidase
VQITDHRLQLAANDDGPALHHEDSPNAGANQRPELLVIHYTAGRSAESSVRWLCDPAAKASAHLVIGRDGTVSQLVPFNRIAWHAGNSFWNGRYGVNGFSIGIELDNAGRLSRSGTRYLTWFKEPIGEADVFSGTHRFESSPGFWHDFTATQVSRCEQIARLLFDHYALADVVGHDEIAPDWLRGPDQGKRDPGPAFPLGSIRARLLGRFEDAPLLYRVGADRLNIRTGAGVSFGLVSAPLRRGTTLRRLGEAESWTHVALDATPSVTGWVASQYIQAVGAAGGVA